MALPTFPTVVPAANPSLCQLAQVSHALSHPSRLALLDAIAQVDPAPLPFLMAETGLSNRTVRQHLATLRRADLVRPGRIDVPPGERGRKRHAFLLNEAMVESAEHELVSFFRRISA